MDSQKLSLIQILNNKSKQNKEKQLNSPKRENRSSTSTTGDEILDTSFENAQLKKFAKQPSFKIQFIQSVKFAYSVSI